MVHYKLEYYSLNYPLGSGIDSSHDFIKNIIKSFLDSAKSDIESHTNIGIVCRGSSGVIMATMLYLKLKKATKGKKFRICHIKKDGESSHTTTVSGTFTQSDNAMYVWIDDFIDSGETFEDCINKMRDSFYINNKSFKFDWAVCATINQKNFDKMELYTKNLVSHLC